MIIVRINITTNSTFPIKGNPKPLIKIKNITTIESIINITL